MMLPALAFAQSAQLADSLRARGETFKDQGRYREAEFYLGEAVSLYDQLQDSAAWLITAREYGSVLVYRSRYEEAFSLFNTILEFDHPANSDSLRADVMNSLGWASNRKNDFREALTYFERALPMSQEANYGLLTAVIYDNMGLSYYRLGNYSRSLELRKKALDSFQEIGNRRSIAITLNNIALLYRELSFYDQALDYFSRSLEIRKELGNVDLLATIYTNLGDLHKQTGNYDQALIAYQKSLEYRRQAGSKTRTSETLNNLGTLYSQLGDSQKALNYYQQALEIIEDLDAPDDKATRYRNIASRLWVLGKRDEAVASYEKAHELHLTVGSPVDIANSLMHLALVERERNDFQTAFRYSRRAVAIADSMKDYNLLANAYQSLGRTHAETEDYRKALDSFRKGWEVSKLVSGQKQLDLLPYLARTYHSIQSDSALWYGRKAIDIIEQGRSKAGAISGLKSSYFRQFSDFYIDMASWTLAYDGDQARAYRYVEAAKARSLSDELVQASERIDEALPEEARLERNRMLKKLDSLYTRLDRATGSERQEALGREIRTAELNYAAFENQLASDYAGYKQLEMREPISLERAREITPAGTAVLEFAVSSDHLISFLITEEGIKSHQLLLDGADVPDLTEQVVNFKDAILANAQKSELDFRSRPLHELLIAPFENDLEGISKLIIVPDGALAYLPFEALLQNDRYLIEDYTIKYLPSLTSLTLLKEPDGNYTKELLAVAGSGTQQNGTSEFRPNSSFYSLPSTLMEVDSIASHFREVTTLKEEQVTESALKEQLKNRYRFIHLAAHGIIDEENPAQSGLVLSTAGGLEISSEEDGLLKSSEIYRLNLNSDMVVLSACNTGLGKMVKGEGMLGLQRSFFYAGSSSVVVSLWSVYDRSTAFMMNEFYKSLLRAEGEQGWSDRFLRWIGWDQSIPYGFKADAMREAKLKMINHPLFNHPVNWAPFIVVGR